MNDSSKPALGMWRALAVLLLLEVLMGLVGLIIRDSLIAAAAVALVAGLISAPLIVSYRKLLAVREIMNQILAQSDRDDAGNIHISVVISPGAISGSQEPDAQEDEQDSGTRGFN